jgi:RNA polymerase sigma factor (sigma-70 family)
VSDQPSDVSRLLAEWRQGDREALERLMPLVYGELPKLAAYHLRAEPAGHTLQPTALDDASAASEEREADLVALDDALTELARLSPQQGRIVELRYFGGLTIEEIAEALGVAVARVRSDWTLARAWLRRELVRSDG